MIHRCPPRFVSMHLFDCTLPSHFIHNRQIPVAPPPASSPRENDRRSSTRKRISKYFDSFLLSGPALCHGSHDITGSTSAFAIVNSSKFFTPENKKIITSSTRRRQFAYYDVTLSRKCFVTLAYYSLATIIHA